MRYRGSLPTRFPLCLFVPAAWLLISGCDALPPVGERTAAADPASSRPGYAIPAAAGASAAGTAPALVMAAGGASAPAAPAVAVRLKARPVTGGNAAPADAPISLSDPDGQELILEDLTVHAAVDGMLSLTELELRFRNPHARRMEGRFSCTLPEGATISRFAKEVNGQLMEGEVVERLKANRVYDQILHEMRDPALLEQDQGNRFSARIFPIEAHGTVRLVLSYSRLLPLKDGRRTFSLPLRGLPTMGRFSFRGVFSALPGEVSDELEPSGGRLEGPSAARRSTVQVMELEESGYTPDRDLEIAWRPEDRAPAVQVLRAGEFYLTSFRAPDLPPQAKSAGRSWVFYVDTSASSAEGQAHRIDALEALLSALPAADRVELFAFDQHVAKLEAGPAATVAKRLRAGLHSRHFLGGTDLEAVVQAVAADASRSPHARFVLVTDGVATLGKTGRQDLAAAVAKVPASTALHALVLGPRQDGEVLQALTEGRGRVVTVPFSEGLTRRAAEAAEALALPVGPTLEIADANAQWLFPASVSDVQPGTEILAVGRLKPGSRPATRLLMGARLVAEAGSDAQPLDMGTFEPLLEREGYRSYLAYLAGREAAETSDAVRQALITEQIKVSTEHRVLIPRTTLLVLETEADYQRFGLDRRALASILTVGAGGIERVDRRGDGRPRPITGPVATQSPAKTSTSSPGGAEDKKKGAADGDGLGEQLLGEHLLVGAMEAQPVAALDDAAGAADVDRTAGGEADEGKADASVETEAAPEPAKEEAAEAFGAGEGAVAGYGSGGAAAPMRRMAANEAAERPVVASAVADGPAAPPPSPAAERAERQVAAPRSSSRAAAAPATRVTAAQTPLPEWTRPVEISDLALAELEAQVRANPRQRAGYNALADVQWSRRDWKGLLETALTWQPYDPENPQVYESLGEAALGLGEGELAARAFASLVEIAPSRPELLQRAGLLLLRAGERELAEAPLRRALELRPDRVNGYRHLALVLWQQGRIEEAAAVLEEATRQQFPGWYGDAQRVLREELGYVYRAWLAAKPAEEKAVRKRAGEYGADLARIDALRITLAWETDANDVDLHVVDPAGEECYYSHTGTASSLELYQDITQGFGPEVMRAGRLMNGTYHVGVNYFSAGPMGVSRGVLVVMKPDARGLVTRPSILPFRLVEGGRDMRHLAAVEIDAAGGAKVTP